MPRPVAKAFNLNFAAAYGDVAAQRVRPDQVWCGDPEARQVTKQLIRDAGYEPVAAGGLENARALEDFVMPFAAASTDAGAPIFYRFARPGDYVVRVEGTGRGGAKAVAHLHVRVEEKRSGSGQGGRRSGEE